MSGKILLLLKSSEIYIRLASAVKEICKMGCASLGRPLFVYGLVLPQSVKKSRKSAFFLCIAPKMQCLSIKKVLITTEAR